MRRVLSKLKRSMVVTMIAVRMMQASVNQIVNMVAVWNGGMATIRTVNMPRVVPVRTMGALIRIGGTNANRMFVYMVAVRMMQMAVVDIIHMAFMFDGQVSATWTMGMGVIGVRGAGMLFAHKSGLIRFYN